MGSNGVRPRTVPFGLQAIDGYKMDALNGVITSVPQWHTLLDNLNSQIALRQFELAELDDYRPPTRSLKPKGSTESLLRPKESDNDPLPDDENENTISAHQDSPDPPTLTRDTAFPNPATPRPTVNTSFKGSPPQVFHHSSSPGPVPLQRRPSGRLNSPNFPSKATFPTVLRKRKTDSIASGGSQAPKYRTRYMIIVYYDSAVQNAFEELVKLISASRNAMRKGKMAARMAEMKRMAELETDTDSEDEVLPEPKDAANGNGHAVTSRPAIPTRKELEPDDDDNKVPKLEFVSTRRMGPSRDSSAAAALRISGNGHVTGMGRRAFFSGYRGTSGLMTKDSFSSFFDEIDSGLEWCQSMCEHAAHQFLRDGNCNTEIAGIKRRLLEVKETAEREAAKAAAEDKKEEPKDEPPAENINGTTRLEESRGLKPIQMRKPFTAIKSLESDQIEVDDEGYDDVLPKLQWRSAAERVP
jgi:hypothetical protein